MTMTSQTAPATGSGDRLRDPMSRVSLSRSSSGDSFYLEEKKTGDASDTTKTFDKKKSLVLSGESMEYRNMISIEPGSKFVPESGRYRLYVSLACPQSHLTLLMLNLKGLNNGTISVAYVHPHAHDDSVESNWMIGDSSSSNYHDSFASLKSEESHDFTSIRDIYQNESDGTNNENNNNPNNYTIPLLYDTSQQTIVNNNTQDICHMLKSCFSDFVATPEVHDNIQFKDEHDKSQSEIREWLYPLLSMAPSTVPPYLYSFHPQELDVALKRAIHILKQQRYLTSPTHISEADLCLFVTLLRYDQVYALHLSQPPRVMQEAALLDYCRDVYQQPGVAETVNLKDILVYFVGPPHNNATTAGTCAEALLDALKMPHPRHLM